MMVASTTETCCWLSVCNKTLLRKCIRWFNAYIRIFEVLELGNERKGWRYWI